MPPLTANEIEDALAIDDATNDWGYDEEEDRFDYEPGPAVASLAILDGRRIERVDDPLVWMRFFADGPRRVAREIFNGVVVSTVFVGVNFGAPDDPMWFETVVHGGDLDGLHQRYGTWAEAAQGHLATMGLIREGMRERVQPHRRVERVRRNNVVD